MDDLEQERKIKRTNKGTIEEIGDFSISKERAGGNGIIPIKCQPIIIIPS